MEETQILNVIGLSLDVIGVAILFFWAPVHPNIEDGIGLGLEDATIVDGKTVSEHNKDKEKQKKKIRILSKIGLVLILIGFFIQIISNLLQD
jgi:hypothetical protein